GRGLEAEQLPAQPVLLPLRPLLPGRAAGGVRDPRARARPLAGRGAPGPLRAEPRIRPGGCAAARPARGDSRARRGPRRPRARPPQLELGPDAALAGALERDSADGHVPRSEAVRLENDDVVVRLAARQLPGDALLQLVDLEPVEHAGLDRLDQGAGLALRVLHSVAADESGAREHHVV